MTLRPHSLTTDAPAASYEAPNRQVADDMTLGELIDFAQQSPLARHSDFTAWLDDHYDTAKAALADLLTAHGISVPPAYEIGDEGS